MDLLIVMSCLFSVRCVR